MEFAVSYDTSSIIHSYVAAYFVDLVKKVKWPFWFAVTNQACSVLYLVWLSYLYPMTQPHLVYSKLFDTEKILSIYLMSVTFYYDHLNYCFIRNVNVSTCVTDI